MSATVTDTAARQIAKNWINTATKSNQWRLQILSRSYRKDSTGTEKYTPVHIRRFVEGCPASCLKEAVDVLLEQAPYTGILYNGNLLSGSFRPTKTEWRRDDQAVVNGLQKTDGTYTLFQDLVEEGTTDTWQGKTSDNCTEEVLSTYHWEASDIESLPTPTQGITYAIQQVSRSEDGTYSYVLVKRTAKTQLNSENTVGDNEFETTYTRLYRNLYGTPESPTDNSGASVSIPTPSGATAGTTIEWNVQPNEDCTFNVTVQKKVAKAKTTETTTSKTLDEWDESETKRAQSSALSEAPAPTGGVIKKHKSELRADGKYDTTETTTTEKAVADSTVTVTVTRKGTRTTHVSKNQATAASTTGLSVGTEVKVEKTPGALYNNTVTSWTNSDPMRVGEKCQVDLYTHTDEATNTGGTMPGSSDHITGGGTGGHVKSRVTTVDDDTGAVIQTVTDKQEQPVAQSFRRWTTTTKGTTYEERNTNQSSAPSHSSTVGTVTTVEKTEGGLYTYSIKTFSAAASGEVGKECSKTIFTHVDRTLTNESAPYSGHVPAASGGVTTSVSSKKNEEGGYDQTVETRTDLPVAEASKETVVTLHGKRVTTVNRNMSSNATGSGKIGSSVKNEKTDSGLVTQTIVETSTEAVGTTRSECTQTGSEHRHSTTENVVTAPSAETTCSAGTITEKAVAKTEYSTYDVTTVTRTAKAQTHSYTYGSAVQSTSATAYKNASSVTVAAGGTNVETRATLTKNDFQLIDGTVATTTYSPQTLGPLNSGNSFVQSQLTFGKNVTSVSGARGGQNEDYSLSASANDHGSYDYTLRYTKYVSVGPIVIGTATSDRKTTEIKFGKNNASAPSVTAGTNEEISISATMNDHGSYDWTSRKDHYNPYGPVTVGQATGTFKTTTITSAYNQLTMASQTAGTNEEISISASMNNHGTFDWTCRKDHYNPYGPVTVATATGTLKTTTITSAYNQTGVTSQTAGTNEEISISASMNSHGSFDWTCRKDHYNPYGPITVGTATGTYKTTTITSAYNQTSVASQTAGTNEEISISASMNSHGSFDWTCRKDHYNPYGPITVATATGTYKTTTITSAYNQTSVASQTAGTNEEISISASMNSHGSFDWTCRKDHYNPYGPITVATATGTYKTTTITSAYNQTTVASQTAGTNEEISISASMNSHGSFDWTCRKDKYSPYGPVTVATATGTYKTTTITSAYNQTSVASQTASTNEDISISASMNSHGSFDWTCRKDHYNPYGPVTVGTATGTFKTTTITSAFNQTSVASQTAGTNEELSLSASMNSHGSFDWTCRKDKYSPYGPVTVATTSGTFKSTTIRAAYNQTSMGSETGGTNVEVSISGSLNSHGTFDWTSRKDTYSPYGPVTVASSSGTFKTTEIQSAFNQTSMGSVSGGQNVEVSISGSMNSHGSFDWTSRKDTYSPYGPVTVATSTGTFKTTVVQSAFNQTSMCSESGGTNVEVSVSGSMNSHGSFDWTSRKDTYSPYGPVTLGTATGSYKTTTIQAAFNQTSAASQSAGQNEEISMSASLNSHGSIDWTCRKDKYSSYGPVTVAQTSGTRKTTTITSAFNQTSMCSETAGENEEISVSGSLNSHGSFDWTCRKDKYTSYGPTCVATTTSGVLTTKHYIGFNNTSVTSQAGGNDSSSMSVSMNSRGTFDTHEVVRTPTEKSDQQTFTTGSGNSQVTHTILVYRNSASIKTLNGTKSASAGASINEFGLFDGSATSADGDSESDENFFTQSGTVSTYIFFNTRGGRRRKQKVTMDYVRKYDKISIVSGSLDGGMSYGPWSTNMQIIQGKYAIGVKYSNLQFEAPEDA